MRNDRCRHTLDWLRSLQPWLPCPGPVGRKLLKEMTSTEDREPKGAQVRSHPHQLRLTGAKAVEPIVWKQPRRGRVCPLPTLPIPGPRLRRGHWEQSEPRQSRSGSGGDECIRGRVCVRRRAKTWLLQNLFKGRWKPLQQLPGEALVPEEEEVVAAKEEEGRRLRRRSSNHRTRQVRREDAVASSPAPSRLVLPADWSKQRGLQKGWEEKNGCACGGGGEGGSSGEGGGRRGLMLAFPEKKRLL